MYPSWPLTYHNISTSPISAVKFWVDDVPNFPFRWDTLPKFNMKPENGTPAKGKTIFQTIIFRFDSLIFQVYNLFKQQPLDFLEPEDGALE